MMPQTTFQKKKYSIFACGHLKVLILKNWYIKFENIVELINFGFKVQETFYQTYNL